jgi:putative flippase GtrA
VARRLGVEPTGTDGATGWSILAAMLGSARAQILRRHPTVQRLGRFALSAIAVQGTYAVLMALFLLALVHFALNRQFVFVPTEGYAHGLSSHGRRYLVSAVVIYGITALGLAVLPGLLGVAPYIAWLMITGTIGALNFFLLGRFVFR